MPKRPAGKKAANLSAQSATPATTNAGATSETDTQPPVSTNEAPTEEQVNEQPMPEPDRDTGLRHASEEEWEPGRREVFLLDNGSTLIARSEVEAGAYLNGGAKLVDVIFDE